MFPSQPPPRPLEGFEILQRLGTGGAGEVFLARSRGGKLVAIKTIAGARRDGDASADSFAREASVCARLLHPCIVQVRAFLEEPGFAALVYEYVPGVALARVVRVCRGHGVRLPDRAGWHIVERVLAALAYAHTFRDRSGHTTPIVHRDLSPSNVLLDWGGGVKIADFGIAKVLGVSPATRAGLVKGTLGCMAPEQARGDPVDERADVYAAALLAWRLATGRVPFAKHEKDELEMLRAMRHPRIKPLGVLRPDLAEPLLEAIACALEAEPERRTISAGELADVVRTHIDVELGNSELSELLNRWKPMLERTVRRAPDRASEMSLGRMEHTLRYEEVALAFDDDALPDSPTFEAHALPSDPSLLAALPLAEHEPLPSTVPPAMMPAPPPAPPPRISSPRARRVFVWAPLVIVGVFLLAGTVAALLAMFAR
jgi:serine/threonine protein kinase